MLFLKERARLITGVVVGGFVSRQAGHQSCRVYIAVHLVLVSDSGTVLGVRHILRGDCVAIGLARRFGGGALGWGGEGGGGESEEPLRGEASR